MGGVDEKEVTTRLNRAITTHHNPKKAKQKGELALSQWTCSSGLFRIKRCHTVGSWFSPLSPRYSFSFNGHFNANFIPFFPFKPKEKKKKSVGSLRSSGGRTGCKLSLRRVAAAASRHKAKRKDFPCQFVSSSLRPFEFRVVRRPSTLFRVIISVSRSSPLSSSCCVVLKLFYRIDTHNRINKQPKTDLAPLSSS